MTTSYLQFPQIDPVIFSVGPVALRWYGLMYMLAFIATILMANKAADKSNGLWNRDEVSDLLFYGFLGVILGGRVGYVLFYQFDLFLADPTYLLKIWEGGMSFHGGLLGVILGVFAFAKKTGKSFLTVGDFVAPLAPFGLGAGRIGNFINGELWGRETDVPWAMVFPSGGNVPRHPSQLYEFFLEGLVLFVIIFILAKKPRGAGLLSGTFLFGYGVFRMFIEFFREPDAHIGLYLSFISHGQLLSLPMVIVGLGLIIYSFGKGQQQVTGATAK